jgi:uncharacterized BrkB/YihY/UPF0761 family membrane protein
MDKKRALVHILFFLIVTFVFGAGAALAILVAGPTVLATGLELAHASQGRAMDIKTVTTIAGVILCFLFLIIVLRDRRED